MNKSSLFLDFCTLLWKTVNIRLISAICVPFHIETSVLMTRISKAFQKRKIDCIFVA